VTERTQARAGLAVAALSLCLTGAELFIIAVGEGLPFSDPNQPALVDYVSSILFPLVAGLIAYRRPGNRVGWLLLGYSLAVALASFVGAWGHHGVVRDPGSLPLAGAAVWLGTSFWMAGLVFLPLMFLRFPTGKLLSPAWRWAQRLCLLPVVIVTVPAVGLIGEPAPLMVDAFLEDERVARLEWARVIFEGALITLIVVTLISLTSLVVRYRRSPGLERLQLKWVMWASGILVLSGVWETIVLSGVWENIVSSSALTAAVSAVAFAAIPVSIAVAVLRYRLYEIDRLINRTLVYAVLTAFLAAAYLGIVVALQNLIPGADDSDLTIAVSTLAVAALFRPLRTRVQSFIDRRFYRGRYDAQLTLERFTARLRDEIDLDALNRELVAVVADTMQPAHASLWLRETTS
jgi:hypothetical protein